MLDSIAPQAARMLALSMVVAALGCGDKDVFDPQQDEEPCPAWAVQVGTEINEEASDMARDPSGNFVLVAQQYPDPQVEGNFHLRDVVVTKLDDEGTHLWTRTLDSGQIDEVDAVTTDAQGNVVVVGSTRGALGEKEFEYDYDAFVAVFDPQGELTWLRQFGSYDWDCGFGVVVDTAGSIYVVGEAGQSIAGAEMVGWADGFVAKYSSDGELLWVKHVGTDRTSWLHGVTIDANEQLLVVGSGDHSSTPGWDHDLYVAKLSAWGDVIWQESLRHEGEDAGFRVASDRDQAVIVAGRVDVEGEEVEINQLPNYDPIVVKWTADGVHEWTYHLETSPGDSATDVVVDSDGYIYASGWSSSGLTEEGAVGSHDVFVVKLDSDGEEVWLRQMGSWGIDYANAIALDDEGVVHVAGATRGRLYDAEPQGEFDSFLMQLCED